MKITAIEIYSQYNNGWTEIELFGLVNIDLLSQLVWKGGKKTNHHIKIILLFPSIYAK